MNTWNIYYIVFRQVDMFDGSGIADLLDPLTFKNPKKVARFMGFAGGTAASGKDDQQYATAQEYGGSMGHLQFLRDFYNNLRFVHGF